MVCWGEWKKTQASDGVVGCLRVLRGWEDAGQASLVAQAPPQQDGLPQV